MQRGEGSGGRLEEERGPGRALEWHLSPSGLQIETLAWEERLLISGRQQPLLAFSAPAHVSFLENLPLSPRPL